MKHFYVTVLLIVLLRLEFVKTKEASEENYRIGSEGTRMAKRISDSNKYYSRSVPNEFDITSSEVLTVGTATERMIDCNCKSHTKALNATIYVLTSVIVVLCFVVIGLLLLVYKLKKKCDYDDKIEIIKPDSSSKYIRQLSSETTDVTFTRENSNEDCILKLTREGSNMSTLGYPNNQDTNKKKHEEPHASTNTLNKIIHLQPKQIQQDQIKAICEAVLLKSQKRNEYTSLSNLDKIVSEGKAKEGDANTIDKSMSSGILEVVDSSAFSPSPLSVKNVINNFEVLPSPISPRKLNKSTDNKHQTMNIYKIDADLENVSSLPFRLSEVNTAKVVDVESEDDIYDNPPQGKRPVSSCRCEDEQVDDVYVDPPNNKPVSFDKGNDEHVDDVYDNPPNNKPVKHTSDDHLEDIYEDPTNNRSVFNAVVDNDEIYDSVQSEKFLTDKDSSSQQKVKKDDKLKEYGDYDFPIPPAGRGIVVTSDDHSGYSVTLTTVQEPCFDSSYVNARSFNC